MSNLTRAITAAASGVGGARTLFAIPHNSDSTADLNNLSLYELDGDQLVLLDKIRAHAADGPTAARQVAFNPDPDTYGNILAVTTNQGVSIIDYSNDTLTEVDDQESSLRASYGCAYSSDGSKLFTSGTLTNEISRFDQATNGTLSNRTSSASFGLSERINAIAIAKTKDVGIVVFNKGSSASIGAHTFTPSDFSLDSSFVTRTEEVLNVDISQDGTFAVYVGKDAVSAPVTSTGRMNISSTNVISGGNEQNIGSAPNGVAIAPNQNHVATGGNSSNWLRIYNAAMSSLAEEVNPGFTNPSLCWDSESEYLVSFIDGGPLKLWGWNGSNTLTELDSITGLPSITATHRMASITI
tara:strand:- start:295 stop:1356 length:1062 start_codon:yes stop_codon:yes gene_type:complete